MKNPRAASLATSCPEAEAKKIEHWSLMGLPDAVSALLNRKSSSSQDGARRTKLYHSQFPARAGLSFQLTSDRHDGFVQTGSHHHTRKRPRWPARRRFAATA